MLFGSVETINWPTIQLAKGSLNLFRLWLKRAVTHLVYKDQFIVGRAKNFKFQNRNVKFLVAELFFGHFFV